VALGRALSVTVLGMEGDLITVEAHIASGLPKFGIVGLPDAALNESADRVRSAAANAGHALPAQRITINLSPSGLRKAGTAFDLPIAAALLAAAEVVPTERTGRVVHLGELGLDGRVRPVRGVLPAVLAAVREGIPDVVVAPGNAREAELVPGARVSAVADLAALIRFHGGDPGAAPDLQDDARPAAAASRPAGLLPRTPDLADVIGQAEGRFAAEVAAAGGHHLMLIGPPGAGKTLLAARLPGLLPDLTHEEAVEVTAIHSMAGTLDASAGLIRRPPFESPHHTATAAALVGGGSGLPRPGAASRAHRGVLLLDEAAEFEPRVLDALREPMEQGELVIHRTHGAARFPARFQLVIATNPCPCGLSSGAGIACTCPASVRRRYLGRLSGPLQDRVDIRIEVQAVGRRDLDAAERPESTAVVARRVARARERQRERLAGTGWRHNGEVPGPWLREDAARLPRAVTAELDRALDRGGLSIRGYDRVLRVAWTICDLAGADRPDADHVGVALSLRMPGDTP
jgi:magnesium chelatase family protein